MATITNEMIAETVKITVATAKGEGRLTTQLTMVAIAAKGDLPAFTAAMATVYTDYKNKKGNVTGIDRDGKGLLVIPASMMNGKSTLAYAIEHGIALEANGVQLTFNAIKVACAKHRQSAENDDSEGGEGGDQQPAKKLTKKQIANQKKIDEAKRLLEKLTGIVDGLTVDSNADLLNDTVGALKAAMAYEAPAKPAAKPKLKKVA